MVIPRSRSALSLSKTQAYLKDPLPNYNTVIFRRILKYQARITYFVGFLFELFNDTLVNTTALVDQVTSGGGLSRVDVTNDDDANVSLFLSGHIF